MVIALLGRYTKLLFDLKNDPNERVNLINNPNYSEIKVIYCFLLLPQQIQIKE